MNPEPLAFICDIDLDPPSPSDKTADADRLLEGIRKSVPGNVKVPLDILRRLPEALRRDAFRVKVVAGLSDEGLKVLDLGKERIFGIALDIGSTNMECSLFDLISAEKIGQMETVNPQVAALTDQDALVAGGARLIDHVLHLPGRQKLPLLDVNRSPGRGHLENEIGLAAQKCRRLQHIHHLGDLIDRGVLVYISEHR